MKGLSHVGLTPHYSFPFGNLSGAITTARSMVHNHNILKRFINHNENGDV